MNSKKLLFFAAAMFFIAGAAFFISGSNLGITSIITGSALLIVAIKKRD